MKRTFSFVAALVTAVLLTAAQIFLADAASGQLLRAGLGALVKGGESDLSFAIAWAAVFGVPYGLVVVTPVALVAWRREWSRGYVILAAAAAGVVPSSVLLLLGVFGPDDPALQGTGEPLYVVSSLVGSLAAGLVFHSLRSTWKAPA